MTETVVLMLGGNIGDTASLFEKTCSELQKEGFCLLQKSSLFITVPVDCVPGTPDFVNQALLGTWSKSPRELLALTQKTEQASGRPRLHSSREARTLDIDIILFGQLVLCEKDLIIPHPRAHQRLFVLEPLCSIAPDLRFPDLQQTAAELLAQLQS